MDHRQVPPPRDDFYWNGRGPHNGHEGWWGGPLHVLVLILFVALLVAAAFWLVRRLWPGVARAATPAVTPAGAVAAGGADPAVATLRMRYARGEVSREDFQQALADLTGAETPTEAWPGGDAGQASP